MIFYAELGINLDMLELGDVEARIEQLLEALADLEENDPVIEDVDITATLATGDVLVNMCIDAADLGEAGQKLVATVRSALHEIGDGTPGWERVAHAVHEACMNVRAPSVRELAEA